MEKQPIPKLEKVAISKEKMLENTQDLFKVFGTETIDEQGEITIENELMKVNIRYEDLIFDIKNIPRTEEAFIGTELNVNERALIRFLNFHPEQYQLLKECRIQSKQDNSIINISDELGENTIYVKKNGNDVSESAAHYLNTYIKLNIEPKSAAGILTMLHEVGHKKDPAIDPLEIMLVSLGKEKDEAILQKEMIDRERYAWAYSLNKLRPFFDGLNITLKDVDIFVHKWALGSYSSLIDSTILEKETKSIFSKIINYLKK